MSSVLGSIHLMQGEHGTQAHGQYTKPQLKDRTQSNSMRFYSFFPFQIKRCYDLPHDFVCKRLEFPKNAEREPYPARSRPCIHIQ